MRRPPDPGLPDDTALARLCLGAEIASMRERTAGAPAALVAELGLRCEPVDGGTAFIADRFPHATVNRVTGFGLDEPLDEPTLDRTIAFYPHRVFSIQPSPMARPPRLAGWLTARGFAVNFHWLIWAREAQAPPAEPATGLELRRLDPEHADEFAALVCTAYANPARLARLHAAGVGRPRWHHWGAFDDGRLVSAGILYVHGEVGRLFTAGTLPAHRGRGAQGALLARRMWEARALGCRWVTAETADDLPDRPNPSVHNLARLGFRLLHRRPAWMPRPAGAR
jgi:GNAT superfamily N-acetyltransferase